MRTFAAYRVFRLEPRVMFRLPEIVVLLTRPVVGRKGGCMRSAQVARKYARLSIGLSSERLTKKLRCRSAGVSMAEDMYAHR